MRALKAAVIIMGVLIVAGVAVLIVALTQRVGAVVSPAAGNASLPAMLAEPEGTHIAGASVAGDRLVLRLSGGGPDRVVVFDLARGRVVGQVALAH